MRIVLASILILACYGQQQQEQQYPQQQPLATQSQPPSLSPAFTSDIGSFMDLFRGAAASFSQALINLINYKLWWLSQISANIPGGQLDSYKTGNPLVYPPITAPAATLPEVTQAQIPTALGNQPVSQPLYPQPQQPWGPLGQNTVPAAAITNPLAAALPPNTPVSPEAVNPTYQQPQHPTQQIPVQGGYQIPAPIAAAPNPPLPSPVAPNLQSPSIQSPMPIGTSATTAPFPGTAYPAASALPDPSNPSPIAPIISQPATSNPPPATSAGPPPQIPSVQAPADPGISQPVSVLPGSEVNPALPQASQPAPGSPPGLPASDHLANYQSGLTTGGLESY